MRSPTDPLELLGTIINEKYLVEAFVAEGGFSAVYRAQHLVWQSPVALKCFVSVGDLSLEERDAMVADFIQEGRLLGRLSSRSAAIVQARDVGRLPTPDGGWVPYMVLEWLDGDALDTIFEREQEAAMPPRTMQEAMTLLEPVASALHLAHCENVAHRDLKPANIICVGSPRSTVPNAKLLDFGIAKVMAGHDSLPDQRANTGHSITSFTPHYGAPEQFSREYGATGPWTDVYAMALIFVEALTGKRALMGRNVYELGVASCNAEVRPTPRGCGVDVNDDVEDLFDRALAIHLERRPASMGLFWLDLCDALGLSQPAWCQGPLLSIPAPAPAPAPASPEPRDSLEPRVKVDTEGVTVPALSHTMTFRRYRNDRLRKNIRGGLLAILLLGVGTAFGLTWGQQLGAPEAKQPPPSTQQGAGPGQAAAAATVSPPVSSVTAEPALPSATEAPEKASERASKQAGGGASPSANGAAEPPPRE